MILCDFHFIFLSFFHRLTSRFEEAVWRGLMTCLYWLFRLFLRQGAGHSGRTQDRDGSKGSKVQGGLAGRTSLCYLHHKLLPLRGQSFVLWVACLFPFSLSLPLFTISCVFLLVLVFLAHSFQVSASILVGTPKHVSTSHDSSRSTYGYPLCRSMKNTYRGISLCRPSSCNRPTTNNISIVDRAGRKSHCSSVRNSSVSQ